MSFRRLKVMKKIGYVVLVLGVAAGALLLGIRAIDESTSEKDQRTEDAIGASIDGYNTSSQIKKESR